MKLARTCCFKKYVGTFIIVVNFFNGHTEDLVMMWFNASLLFHRKNRGSNFQKLRAFKVFYMKRTDSELHHHLICCVSVTITSTIFVVFLEALSLQSTFMGGQLFLEPKPLRLNLIPRQYMNYNCELKLYWPERVQMFQIRAILI